MIEFKKKGDYMKYTDIKEEIEKHFQPDLKYLIENRNNPKKINSNLDISCENIREIDALIQQLEGYRRDFTTMKKIIENNAKQQDKCK